LSEHRQMVNIRSAFCNIGGVMILFDIILLATNRTFINMKELYKSAVM